MTVPPLPCLGQRTSRQQEPVHKFKCNALNQCHNLWLFVSVKSHWAVQTEHDFTVSSPPQSPGLHHDSKHEKQPSKGRHLTTFEKYSGHRQSICQSRLNQIRSRIILVLQQNSGNRDINNQVKLFAAFFIGMLWWLRASSCSFSGATLSQSGKRSALLCFHLFRTLRFDFGGSPDSDRHSKSWQRAEFS